MRVAICDDDVNIAGKIEMLILNNQHLFHENFDLSIFQSGEELLLDLQQNNNPYHIFLLDIEMNTLTGIDVAHTIRDYYQNKTSQIIFVSSHEERWKELFAVNPIGFVTKPICEREFLSLLSECVNKLKPEHLIFSYKYKNNIGTAPIQSILYFESVNHNVNIITEQDKRVIHTTMKSIVQELHDVDFVLIHKSYFVNLLHVVRFLPSSVTMSNNIELPLSRNRKTYVEKTFSNYITAKKMKGIHIK